MQNESAQEVIRGYRMLNKVEKDYPDDPDVLTALGSVLLRGKQPAEALRHLERALQLDPLLQQAVELLSSVYKDQDEDAKAVGLVGRYQREMGITAAE